MGSVTAAILITGAVAVMLFSLLASLGLPVESASFEPLLLELEAVRVVFEVSLPLSALLVALLMRGLVRDDQMRDLVYSARVVEAEEAVSLGLGTRLCDNPLAAAREMARSIAMRSPSAIRAAKRLLNQANRSADDSASALLMAESVEQSQLIGSSDQAEAVRANLEKRLPVFGSA